MKKDNNGDKIYHIVDCKKYSRQFEIGFLASFGLWMGTLFTPNMNDQLILWLVIMACKTGIIHFQKMICNTIEYKRFKEIYQNILTKYIKMNKGLEFNSPLEIYTLFNFAINHGLFSLTPKKEVNNLHKLDSGLVKEITLNNHGCCRHISNMLVDIYEHMEIDSQLGICYLPKIVRIKEELTDEEQKEFCDSIQNLFREMPILEDFIIYPSHRYVEKTLPPSKFELKNGNHAICLANDSEYTYYLDALNSQVFTSTSCENKFISNNDITITMNSNKLQSKLYHIQPKEIKPAAPMEYMLENMYEARSRIFDNFDVLNDLKNDIHDELEEAEEIYRLILK